jgi:PAS domain S-box-containing protein
MKKGRKTSAASELEDLRARLEEAEQTIEAIRSGKVDALVVAGPDGERIFTLQGADHRYRRIVEGMTEGAVIVDRQGVVLYANSSFANLVATPLERVLGSPLRRYVPESAAGAMQRLIVEAHSRTTRAEMVLLAGADRVVPVQISAAADGETDHVGICLIVTNLSGAMGEARQRFQFVADMLPQMIWSARPDGWLDYSNRRWLEYTGTTLEETQRQGWRPVLHPDDLDEWIQTWSHSVKSGEPCEIAHRIKRASDGAYRWHLGRALPQRASDGAILRWYGAYTDIEDERALGVEAARARDRAEEATRLKDEFLATLSHELRTPLNAILGWGRMLQGASVPEDQRPHAIDTIVRNASAQNQLIDDLLDVSRIVSGKLRLQVSPIDVGGVIDAALDVVRPAADAKGVRLHLVLDADVGLVAGDAGRLQQVVWNLLANAVKFTPRGGRVHVTLRRNGSLAELSVADTGSGISSAFLPYVFDRFRQQDGAITRRAGGLGLGLAIVRSIVELHGGSVEAMSDGEDRGSTFVVRLPITPLRTARAARTMLSPAAPEPIPAATPAKVAGLTVLVVDDEADARDLIRAALEQRDAVVKTVASASEALEVVGQLKPDVIVSDIGMPDEDGYAFIRRLRSFSREAGGRTPAVALTAYARPEDRTRALMAGFQSHATKPIDPNELLVVIANLAGRYSPEAR